MHSSLDLTLTSLLTRTLRPVRSAPLLLAVSVLAGCGGGAGGGEKEAAAAERTTPTALVLAPSDVVEARVTDVTTGVLVTGTLQPADQVTVTAQVSGTLGNVTVDRGSRVARGQLMATIQAEGVRSRVAGAQSAIAAAEAQVAVARTQMEAQRRLFEAGASSRVDYENAQAAYAGAMAQLTAARAESTAAAEAAGYTEVRAPIAGMVSNRAADPGEAVSPGDPLLTVVNTRTLELAGRIPVDEAGTVRVGQAVTFTLDAFPGREFRGSVARKDPVADPSTRQVGIYVQLPNPNGEITAGQYARGRVSGRTVEDAVTVPATAVRGSGEQGVVFVVQDNRLERREVTLGVRDETTGVVAVTSGLQGGERVLARPSPSIADGQPVVVSTDQPTGAQVQQRDSARPDTTRADTTTPAGGAGARKE